MRIVSWNIRAGGGRRLRDIADQLERWQPDVVAPSEFRGTAPSTTVVDKCGIVWLRQGGEDTNDKRTC